jgi:hypothetical protein
VLSAVAHNATSITVFNGMIEASSCLDPKGLIRMDLSGKRPLGPAGAQQLGRALADSAMPSVLTALEIRLVALHVKYQMNLCDSFWLSLMHTFTSSIRQR